MLLDLENTLLHRSTPAATSPTVLPHISAGDITGHIDAGLRRRIDERLAGLLPEPASTADRIAAAMRYGALAPGKRIRPLLVLLTARALGQPEEQLMDAACALEMVHAASLFLDDMPCMDNATLRRGQPTVHIAYGEDVAVLGAIALLSLAWRTIAASTHLPATLRSQLVVVLADAVGAQGLVLGQYRDLHEGASQRDPAAVASANLQKTGSLFTAAFDMAALAASAEDRVRRSLQGAAAELGHAFQLSDDLDDAEKNAIATGKDAGQDAGKSTLVKVLGKEAVRQKIAGHLHRLETHLSQALPPGNEVVQMLRRGFHKEGPALLRAKQ